MNTLKLKRITVFFILVMLLSLIACSGEKNKEETTIATEENSEQQSDDFEIGESEGIRVNLHYFRDDGIYEGWNAWIWSIGEGTAYEFDVGAVDDKGVVTSAVIPVAATQVGFIVRLNEWESQDPEGDRFVDISDIVAGTLDIYATTGKSEFEIVESEDVVHGAKVLQASLNDDFKTVHFELSSELEDVESSVIMINSSNQQVDINSITLTDKSGIIELKEKADPFETYYIVMDRTYKYEVTSPDIYSSEDFEQEYTYTGEDLGAVWTESQTVFRVWAPMATGVSVNLYKGGDASVSDLVETIPMKESINGTWIIEKEGDLNGVYYTYTASVGGVEEETCDPYARTTGVNGDRAMVVNLDATNPVGWEEDKRPNTDLKITDAIIYELHIRDLSSDSSSGITNKGKYLGLTEQGTVNSNGDRTGLDYMEDLGITHLHINPVYDFATVDESKLDTPQFNWGYDPKNYNTPEGSYSTDPYNGEVRVNEFKQMVQALHKKNISVVMDVVYNHTYNTEYCFNKLVPGYFYRINKDGSYSNGSGCGNDVASERSMVSKFIVDSVVYWAKEYHIDGFRFDLVGLTDIETVNAIRMELDKIDPSIMMYGEGWTLATTTMKEDVILATQPNTSLVTGMAMFNDDLRDAIKGSVFNASEKGFVNGDYSFKDRIKDNLLGLPSWSPSPMQVINYTSCHDNLTLWDKINSSNAEDTIEDRVKQNLLAASMVYTSQGVPFMLAGEEMLRTKVKEDGSFDHNSYASSTEINSMKWDVLSEAQYKTVHAFYKGLIEFRKAHASLRMTEKTKENITFSEDTEDGVITYQIDKVEGEVSDGIFVIYNAKTESTTITLPKGDWNVCIKGDKAGTEILETVKGSVVAEPISCVVLVKGDVK